MLTACLLPRSGPSKDEILAGSVEREGDAFIIAVNDDVNRVTSIVPAFRFSDDLLSAEELQVDTIRPGDSLELKIWENVQNALLGGSVNGPANLTNVEVDEDGYIFVPYAGRILVADKTIEDIRLLITSSLSQQTPDPQVEILRIPGDGATVEVTGGASGQGVFPLERSVRTLSAVLAVAGGVTIEPEEALVTVLRDDQIGKIWYEDLLESRDSDIALRPGDRIIVRADTREFTALGATGAQTRVPLEGRTISALDALASVGGLNSNLADPTGIFVFRNEPQEIARALTGEEELKGAQRIVYVVDLTDINAIFVARDFAIRDGDTVYVTEAPFVTWNKVIAALTGSLSSINTLNTGLSGT